MIKHIAIILIIDHIIIIYKLILFFLNLYENTYIQYKFDLKLREGHSLTVFSCRRCWFNNPLIGDRQSLIFSVTNEQRLAMKFEYKIDLRHAYKGLKSAGRMLICRPYSSFS